MGRYICASIIIAVGIAVCAFAPVAWRLVGAFCVGGGCYAIIEALKFARIEREIERYERPAAELQSSRRMPVRISQPSVRTGLGLAGTRAVLSRHTSKTQQPNILLPHRSSGMLSRTASLARMFLYTISTLA